MGNNRKKSQPVPLPVDRDVRKDLDKKEIIVFTEVSEEELKRRRVPVYPYVM